MVDTAFNSANRSSSWASPPRSPANVEGVGSLNPPLPPDVVEVIAGADDPGEVAATTTSTPVSASFLADFPLPRFHGGVMLSPHPERVFFADLASGGGTAVTGVAEVASSAPPSSRKRSALLEPAETAFSSRSNSSSSAVPPRSPLNVDGTEDLNPVFEVDDGSIIGKALSLGADSSTRNVSEGAPARSGFGSPRPSSWIPSFESATISIASDVLPGDGMVTTTSESYEPITSDFARCEGGFATGAEGLDCCVDTARFAGASTSTPPSTASSANLSAPPDPDDIPFNKASSSAFSAEPPRSP